ncbi:hypothetical protein BBJ28_00006709 [Nothophytophthora sp. Chile5]|nr:hypothetical protein BBJ28_00006709 [Nothophytophthora sp. Chile5]
MFAQLKRESLRKLRAAEDKSPKGCIDEPIVDMIQMINDHPDYVRAANSWRRIAVFCGEAAVGNAAGEGGAAETSLITKGGKWLLAEHRTITFDQLDAALHSPDASSSTSNMLLFKHEPFIMHVVCRDLNAAKELLQWGIACGFRESGVVLGNRKIMCAIRTAANGLEIPLARSADHLLVSDEYLHWIVDIANQKFEANKQKTDRLFDAFRTKFCHPVGPPVSAASLGSTIALSSWKELANQESLKLVGHTSVQYEDSIVVFGGQGPTASGTTTRVADVRIFADSEDGSLQQTYHATAGASGPSARMYHSAVMVGKRMIVFGGRASPATAPFGSVMYVYGGRDAERVYNDLFALDLRQHPPQWRQIGMPSLEGVDGQDEGATRNDGEACLVFDTVEETWDRKELENPWNKSQPPALFAASSCAVSDHQLVVVGGMTSTLLANGGNPTQKIYALDIDTAQWTELGEVKHKDAAFAGHSCTWMPNSKSLYVLGGGFQCFGFGQFYSSQYQCQLSLSSPSKQAVGVDKSSSVSNSVVSGSAPAASLPSAPNDQPLGVLVGKLQVKKVKTLLEKAHVYDKTRRIHVVPNAQLSAAASDGKATTAFLIPVTPAIRALLAWTSDADLHALEVMADEDTYANKFGKTSGLNRNDAIRSTVAAFASKYQLSAELQKAIPEKYEFVSDVLLVPRESFLESEWTPFASEMWAQVRVSTTPPFSRVARKAFIDTSEKRQSHVELLYVNHDALTSPRSKEAPGWVEIRENGIVYGWDLTRVMFSSGNVTEKARMASIGCRGETIVDLFCGIGYYVLPFLVHGGAAFVHACEWNPDSVAALRFNLERNHVADKCKVYLGDNRESAPTIGAVADRVNLGLLPTSEKAWPLAVQVLKPSGGWFHVHDNVAVEDREAWEQRVLTSMRELALQFGKHWTITCEHVEKVKSYAPKVHHLVADIRCAPIASV